MIRQQQNDVQRLKMQQRMEHEETLQREMEQRMLIEEQKRNLADQVSRYSTRPRYYYTTIDNRQ